MTLAELSVCYEEAAVPLRRRLRELRLMLAATETRRKSGAASAALRN